MPEAKFSRRIGMRFLFAVAVAVFAMLSPAYAENWQEFRPKDSGFRIEMPDKPELKTEQRNGRPTYSATVGIDKSVAGADLVFLVKYQEANQKPGPDSEKVLDNVVKALAEGGKLLSDKKETLGRYPARRFAVEDADKDNSEMRSVITDRYFVQVIFLGPSGNPLGKRFLDSFTIVEP
jgi:hypothetical protein